LYRDSKGLIVVWLACPQQVIQYAICEKIRACRNILAASIVREDLICLVLTKQDCFYTAKGVVARTKGVVSWNLLMTPATAYVTFHRKHPIAKFNCSSHRST